MAGTGASSPYIKDEPEDQFFMSNQRYMNGQQGFGASQQQFGQFGSHGSGTLNPNDLTMGNNGVPISNGNGYGGSLFQQNLNAPSSAQHSSYSRGISTFEDDELLDSLGPSSNHGNMSSNGNLGGDFDFQQDIYTAQNGASSLAINANHLGNGYSSTPDGDPIQSPFIHNFNNAQFRMQPQHNFGSSLQSPASYSGSPHTNIHAGSLDANYAAKQRPRLSQVMQGRKSSSTRSPLTPKTAGIAGLNIGSSETPNFASQPIRTSSSHRHQKTLSGQWDKTPGSLNSFPGSDYSSPVQSGMHHPNAQISEIILKGASMPAKLTTSPAQQTQDAKRRKRRESHNLVERRRRDNINERIQELSHLVPLHRLEDEKVRKVLQNNSPLSPTMIDINYPSGISPPQATSGLAGPGARRATAAGNITTGIPIEEKDKGPNKGDILNGAVSWTRDLMWMLQLKLQQNEELANLVVELGGAYPYEATEEEKRMNTELMDAMQKNDGANFVYSRHPGSGLRVPKHTDIKGEAVGSSLTNFNNSLSPDNHGSGDAGQLGMGGLGQYWSGHNSGGNSGPGSTIFKEEDEDEYEPDHGMDMS
ncbi:hypothetical protein BJ878DRAFT_45237 [Calycina marina]|uniref:BHLH domain-containing protein n=1 Tax=Calycina marina TaxID=1763456 RepID=A0A9P7ZA31_9HELO|nr:hypothetical protein BJ878DRAFT_45237 [Calycina marina]